jgi:membrane protease subunit HflC
MNRLLAPILIAAAVVVFLAANTFFIVPQTKQAIVLQFGAVTSVVNTGDPRTGGPGLYIKAPFIQNVIMLEKRNLGINLEQSRIVAADQEQLEVDAFARWRISNPLRYYQAVTGGSEPVAQNRLRAIMVDAFSRSLGKVPSRDIISARRAELMRTIAEEMNKETQRLGIQIIDVRIRQADLPGEVQERTFERMRTERQQVAAKLRAEGDQQATQIRAEADRAATIEIATAREQAEKIRGQGDAERAKIFAQSFGRDPDFAAFYRSMQAYERALPPGTQMIMPPDGEFFRYMRDKDGAARR